MFLLFISYLKARRIVDRRCTGKLIKFPSPYGYLAHLNGLIDRVGYLEPIGRFMCASKSILVEYRLRSFSPWLASISLDAAVLEPKKTCTGKKTCTRFSYLLHTSPPKITNHTEQPPEMAETLPYLSLPHDEFWPLLGQKSCYKKTYRTEMGARTPRPIWMNAVGLRSGLIVRARPYRTGCVFFPSHHHQHGY